MQVFRQPHCKQLAHYNKKWRWYVIFAHNPIVIDNHSEMNTHCNAYWILFLCYFSKNIWTHIICFLSMAERNFILWFWIVLVNIMWTLHSLFYLRSENKLEKTSFNLKRNKINTYPLTIIFSQRIQQQAVIILPSSLYESWGLILHELNSILILDAIKTIFPSPDSASRIGEIAQSDSDNHGNRLNRKSSVILTKGAINRI